MPLPEEVLSARRALAEEILTTVPSAVAAAARHREAISAVIGVGVGAAVPGRQPAGDLVLRVYVTDAHAARKVPPRFNGLPVRVELVGEAWAALAPALPVRRLTPGRPVAGGVSIGHGCGDTGTLGCLVRDDREEGVYILSNNHVLARCNQATPGDTIVQPGPADGGQVPADVLAEPDRWVDITFGGHQLNRVDAALARVGSNQVGRSVCPFISPDRGDTRSP